MGLFDRFGLGRREAPAHGPAADPVMPAAGTAADEQAIARYRYLLRTAPPEAIEQAHSEAFAQLTPEQRGKVLESLHDVPGSERAAVLREGTTPGALARAATRAELKRPGTMERAFAGGPGLGTMMGGTMLSSMAGMVLGSMVAQHFLHDHPADAAAATGSDAASDTRAAQAPAADDAGFADAGGDAGFDGGFDV